VVAASRSSSLAVAFLAVLASACGRLGYDATALQAAAANDGGAGDVRALPPGLVAYWPLDEAAGQTRFSDASGQGNDGSCTMCPMAGVPGVRGTAVRFVPRASILIDAGPALTTLTAQITIAAWARLRTLNGYAMIVSNDRDCDGCGGPYRGFSLWADSYGRHAPKLQIWNDVEPHTGVQGPEVLSVDRWYFLAGTYDGATMRLYVDGVLAASRPYTAGIGAPPSFGLRLGAMGFSQTYGIDGVVDEVMIYARALSDAEVAQLHASVR
jgi:hypothetical protein